MTTYRLTSSQAVHAPGLLRWAIHGAKFPRDTEKLTEIVQATYNLKPEVAKALVTGGLEWKVLDDGETVEFTTEEETA